MLELLHDRTSARNAVEHHSQCLAPLDERCERARKRSEEALQTLADWADSWRTTRDSVDSVLQGHLP